MNGIKVLKSFDKRQLWRFFVDGRFHKEYHGWVGYEAKEAGSIQGLINGFEYAIKNFELKDGLTSNYILMLHRICLTNVKAKLSKSTPGDLRYMRSGLAMFSGISTKECIREILELHKDDNSAIFFKKPASELDTEYVYQELQRKKKIRYIAWYPELTTEQEDFLNQKGTLEDFYEVKAFVQKEFAKKIDELVQEYNEAIASVKNDEEKIYAISKLVRYLELLHPFPDGNCRVFACILLNHLLMHNNLSPAILHNPNRDGECSTKEFVIDIQKGIEKTQRLLKNKEESIFKFSINDMKENAIEEFLGMSKELIHVIHKKTFDKKQIFLDTDMLAEITKGKFKNVSQENINFSKVVAAFNDTTQGCLYCMTNMPSWIKNGSTPQSVLERIYKKGANLIIIDDIAYSENSEVPVLIVDNVLETMRILSKQIVDVLNPKRVAITGSVGKTGFKFQLHHLLSKQVPTHIRKDSGNMDISICTSIMSLQGNEEVEITEVAVGGPDIGARRSEIIRPNYCVFTDIGQCHMDGHGSLEGLLRNKSSIVKPMTKDGVCFISDNSEQAYEIKSNILSYRSDAKITSFGNSNISNAQVLTKEFNQKDMTWNITARIEEKQVQYKLPLINTHAPEVSVGVLLVVKQLGYDVVKAAHDYSTFKSYETMGKVYNVKIEEGEYLLYDQSRRGAIQGFVSAFEDFNRITKENDHRKVAIIAGTSIYNDTSWTKEQHEKIADLINSNNIDVLFTIGEFMDYVHENLEESVELKKHTDNYQGVLEDILSEINVNDNVFIMGHGRHKLDNIAKALLKNGVSYHST